MMHGSYKDKLKIDRVSMDRGAGYNQTMASGGILNSVAGKGKRDWPHYAANPSKIAPNHIGVANGKR